MLMGVGVGVGVVSWVVVVGGLLLLLLLFVVVVVVGGVHLWHLVFWVLRLSVVVVMVVVPGIEVEVEAVCCLHCRRWAHEERWCRVEAAMADPRSPYCGIRRFEWGQLDIRMLCNPLYHIGVILSCAIGFEGWADIP